MELLNACEACTEYVSSTYSFVMDINLNEQVAVRFGVSTSIRPSISQMLDVTVTVVFPENDTNPGTIETMEGRGPRIIAFVKLTTLIPIGKTFA